MKPLLILICFAFAKALIAQNPAPSPEVLQSFTAETMDYQGKTFPYRIMLPKDFDTTKRYPLHIFLHGSGERGNDNKAQLTHGGKLFSDMNQEYPAIVLFPQCPKDDYWADVTVEREDEGNVFIFPKNPKPTWAMKALLQLVDTMLENSYVDKNKVYLGGLSMGAMGAFELLYYRPETFAAATVICGAGYPDHVQSWANNTALWIFHGEDDPVVPATYSKVMVEALLKNNIQPRANFYPNVQHDSWTNAFAEPDLFPWVYSKTKESNTPKENKDCTPEWLKFSENTLLKKFQKENAEVMKDNNTNRIVFMGDSITESWSETDPEFWENHPNFINRGVSGQTTSQMLVRFRQDVIDLQPTTVIILAGTNDIAGNTGVTSIKTIANNIYTMSDLAKQHDIKVIISSVLPVYDYPWKRGLEPADQIIALNDMLKVYALKEGHDFLDYHTTMKNEQNGMKKPLSYDGVHCTKQGYEIMEQQLLEKLYGN